MNVQNCKDKYKDNSRKASDICRNLGFAGLALIWAFRVTSGKGVLIPGNLRLAGAFLVVGLALDFFQYMTGTIIWGVYHRIKEKQYGSSNQQFGAPGWINLPTNGFFYMKLTAITLAYILIFTSMFGSFWT
jgi:hypothetical protein